VICALKDAGVIQPDDVLLVMSDFGAVMIVRFELVRLEMSVNERMRVIGVGLVEVLHWHRGGRGKPRHKGESDEGAPEPGRHRAIMDHSAPRLLAVRPELQLGTLQNLHPRFKIRAAPPTFPQKFAGLGRLMSEAVGRAHRTGAVALPRLLGRGVLPTQRFLRVMPLRVPSNTSNLPLSVPRNANIFDGFQLA
jgi:hypothetical protein